MTAGLRERSCPEPITFLTRVGRRLLLLTSFSFLILCRLRCSVQVAGERRSDWIRRLPADPGIPEMS